MIGKNRQNYLSEGILEYTNRLKHYIKFEQKVIQMPKKTANMPVNILQRSETDTILRTIDRKSSIILLDEAGTQHSSVQFSKWLQKNLNLGTDISFVIGGAYGFTDEFRQKYPKIALSKMTFSHQLVRLFFVEQLYRAFTIIKGENYHH